MKTLFFVVFGLCTLAAYFATVVYGAATIAGFVLMFTDGPYYVELAGKGLMFSIASYGAWHVFYHLMINTCPWLTELQREQLRALNLNWRKANG